VWDLNADVNAKNEMGLTSKDYCSKFCKNEDLRNTVMGLLSKMHQNTKVVKNGAAKREKQAAKQRQLEELVALKN